MTPETISTMRGGTKTRSHFLTGHQALEEMRANPGVLFYSGSLGLNTVAAFNGSEYVFLDAKSTKFAQFSTPMLLAADWEVYELGAPKPLSVCIRKEAFAAAHDPMLGPEFARGLLHAASMAEECGQ